MEFLLFLAPPAKEIYSLLSQKIKFAENTAICRKYDIYGWFDPNVNTLTFCTDKIKSRPDAEYYVNETFYHEATHAAQFCKNNYNSMVPLGISPYDMSLSDNRKIDLKTAIAIGGKVIAKLEHEAFWMEDKPGKVKHAVKKYCF